MSIVLGYDDSPGAVIALATAITVAAKWGEQLVLVYGAGERQTQPAKTRKRGRAMLSNAVERAHAAGVDTQVELVDAKPAAALHEVAERLDATVIVVGTVGTSPLKGAMVGSTPHKLLQISSRPVLCVPVG